MSILALVSVAFARPYTTVGFSSTDEVEFADSASGSVRVHYAVDGPATTVLTDSDADGIPDFATNVLVTAEDALALFGELGLEPLVTEAEVGLDGGGSGATDVYMIAFQAGADGAWRSEACDGPRCAGYLLADHAFEGYGNPLFGIETVVPHELFHGVQAAYSPDFPIWMSEGTATWSERQYVDDSPDFMGFASAYLEDVSRPVDRPPGGPVPSFAYGTCLFFDFLTLRHDVDLMAEMLDLSRIDLLADPDADLMLTIDAALQARGDDLRSAFVDFARFNLATGARSGGVPSYPYAERLVAPASEERGSFLDTSPRYFDYAMVYHRLDHPGGPAAIWWEADAPPIHLELFPTADGVIQPSVWTGSPTDEVVDLGDLPEGTYWMLGTVAERIPESIRLRTCLGAADEVAACAVPEDLPGDTDADEGRACGCAGVGGPRALFGALLGALLVRRRRC